MDAWVVRSSRVHGEEFSWIGAVPYVSEGFLLVVHGHLACLFFRFPWVVIDRMH